DKQIQTFRICSGSSSASEHGPQIAEGSRKGRAEKEYPACQDQEQTVQMPDDPRKPPQKRSQKKFFRQQNTSVIQAPGREIPACPVPQPCKEPHGHNISDMFQPSGPVSPQGNINVFPEPCAQRYVLPPPKFRNACGRVGLIKIFREAEAKHFSKSYSNNEKTVKIKRLVHNKHVQ